MLVLVATLGLTVLAAAQTFPDTPKGSVQLVVTGCLNDRVMEATDVEAPEDTVDVPARTFRLSGKKPLMAEVRAHDGKKVEITGFVRKLDLQEPGLKVGGGRIVIGPAASSDPSRGHAPVPQTRIIVLEVIAIEAVPGACG